MSGRDDSKAALLRQLRRVLELDRREAAGEAQPAGLRVLATWQARRLAATYADFRARERYRKAVAFFLEDLYGPGDFSQRDADLERVYPIMSRTLPTAALAALTDALELHALTQELDQRMLRILERDPAFQETLTPAMWASAYRECGQARDRARQIELVAAVGRQLDEVVTHPLVYTLVLLARGPARAAGFHALQDFVERGFRAFRNMGGAAVFIEAVVSRETALMKRLFAGEVPDHWQLEPGTLDRAEVLRAVR